MTTRFLYRPARCPSPMFGSTAWRLLLPRATNSGRFCDAVGSVMAAPRWSHASTLVPPVEGAFYAEVSAEHTDPSRVAVVTLH